MKTKQITTRWLAVAAGALTFATSTEAARPVKPPPPPTTGPAYRIFSSASGFNINDAGQLTGSCRWGDIMSIAFVVTPDASSREPVYFRDTDPADGINDLLHPLPGLPGADNWWGWKLNNAGIVAGTSMVLYQNEYLYESATLWVGDMPIDLSYYAGDDTNAYGVNNHGLVVVGPYRSGFARLPSYVVVPKDTNRDGAPDTWFEDADSDGVNDLLKVLCKPTGHYTDSGGWEYWKYTYAPERGINDAGQTVLNGWGVPSFRLSPDYGDADGDGNPWFADANGDDFNDLMVQLAGLGGADSWAQDINESGQVVGGSGTRAVRWDFAADGTQTVTDLGLLSKTVRQMLALAINDQGEIVGNAEFTSRETAFLYKNGKLYDLAALLTNGAGWANLGASDINNQGIIIGSGDLNGVPQGFVAVPVTQP